MADVRAEVIGLAELQRVLNALGAGAGDMLEIGARAGALLILNDAKRRAPVRTSTLRRSLAIETVAKSATACIVRIGTNVPYARIQEYGGVIQHPGGTPYFTTQAGNTWLRKDGSYPRGTRFTRPHPIRIPAHPYLRPAFDAQRGAALDQMRAALARLVRSRL